MKKELFEDKFIKWQQSCFADDIFKDNVINFILTSWNGEEEGLFGSRYELMEYLHNNYLKYFNKDGAEVSQSIILHLVNKFKNKALYEALKHAPCSTQDLLDGCKLFLEAINPQTQEERINKMKEYIKGDKNE